MSGDNQWAGTGAQMLQAPGFLAAGPPLGWLTGWLSCNWRQLKRAPSWRHQSGRAGGREEKQKVESSLATSSVGAAGIMKTSVSAPRST